MAGNTFGHLFRITTAGESHGPGNVVIIDGIPPGLPLSEADLLEDLARRRPGQSKVTTQRKEPDAPRILSGVFEGRTTGTSVAILIESQDQRSRDYRQIRETYRPGHADYTFDAKYGFRDYRGGGRSSARETNVRVAAGAVAKKLLALRHGIRVVGFVDQIGHLVANIPKPAEIQLSHVEASIVRCPDLEMSDRMIELIETMRSQRDSIGGSARIIADGVPAGWGEPVFDKLKADLAKALFSLPAVVGVEYGAGFGVVTQRGSDHNDPFVVKDGTVRTRGNAHGGILGGISSGMPIELRCAVKPTSSLPQPQETITRDGTPTEISTKGRHDPCLLPRFVPMAEAMVAITLVDHMLRQEAQMAGRPEEAPQAPDPSAEAEGSTQLDT